PESISAWAGGAARASSTASSRASSRAAPAVSMARATGTPGRATASMLGLPSDAGAAGATAVPAAMRPARGGPPRQGAGLVPGCPAGCAPGHPARRRPERTLPGDPRLPLAAPLLPAVLEGHALVWDGVPDGLDQLGRQPALLDQALGLVAAPDVPEEG